jgi:hypothetical protein
MTKNHYRLLFMVAFMAAFSFCWAALAQVPGATPALQGVTNAINAVGGKVPSGINPTIMGFLSLLVAELGMRGFPTQKPWSIFIGLGMVFGALSAVMLKLQTLSNTIGSVFNNTPQPPPAS